MDEITQNRNVAWKEGYLDGEKTKISYQALTYIRTPIKWENNSQSSPVYESKRPQIERKSLVSLNPNESDTTAKNQADIYKEVTLHSFCVKSGPSNETRASHVNFLTRLGHPRANDSRRIIIFLLASLHFLMVVVELVLLPRCLHLLLHHLHLPLLRRPPLLHLLPLLRPHPRPLLRLPDLQSCQTQHPLHLLLHYLPPLLRCHLHLLDHLRHSLLCPHRPRPPDQATNQIFFLCSPQAWSPHCQPSPKLSISSAATEVVDLSKF
mmetsp:Transcript_6461/g.11159  ORF Transcript_6461/g.11159 Transcript_6461/m.11159 type:complete len:265 (-) Transcript_6461:358-1152(-)